MFRDSRRVRQLLGLMILTSITLITVDYRGGDNSPFRGLRRSAGNLFGPVERAVSSAVRPVGNALSALGNVGNADRDAKRLRAELAAIEGQSRLNDNMKRQYDDAMRLLNLLNEGQYRSLAAHVIAVAPSNFSYTVTLDKGSAAGVRANQPVVNANGLVGRVMEVSKFNATVLLAIDLKSKVAGQLSYTGQRGLVEGNGPNRMKFEVTPADTTVVAGQAVVTAGSLFAPAVPIGKVVESRSAPGAPSRTVVIEPYVNFSKLDLVAVIIKQEHPTGPDVLVPSDAPKPVPSSSIPPCPTPAPQARSSAGTAASADPSTGVEPTAPERETLAEPPTVPCLGSMPATTAPGVSAGLSP
ncbi:MAG: rod shape-determining protein MreC [Mycobacteriales bacterium]